jgi:hypothetical protein
MYAFRERPNMIAMHAALARSLRYTLCLPLLLLLACTSKPSPEEQVREVIRQAELAAEARSARELAALLSPEYRDAYGNGPDEVRQLARGYFLANQSLYLLTRVQTLAFPHPDEARATVTVAVVGREADAAGVWPLTADLQTFELVLRLEQGHWKVTWAQWDRR